MAATDGEWPPPGDSQRITALLTVSEGLLFGSLGTFLLSITLALASLVAESPVITEAPVTIVVIAGFLIVIVAIIARRVWSDIQTRRAELAESNGIPDDSYAEWRRTWPTQSVLQVTALVGIVFVTVSVVRIGWMPLGWVVLGAPVLVGTCWFGFALRVYVHYKIRGTIR